MSYCLFVTTTHTQIGSAKDARPANPPDISPEAAAFLDLAFKM